MPDARYAGIMTGTSMDGTDVAVVEIAAVDRVRCLHAQSTRWPNALREQARSLAETRSWRALERIEFDNAYSDMVADHLIQALAAADIPGSSLRAVGIHGVTLAHHPPSSCLSGGTDQALDPFRVAARTGIRTVYDFRRADMARGGEGAPLAPFLDYWLIRDPRLDRVALNLGGIANLTILPANARPDQIRAFDTGPANIISDAIVRSHQPDSGFDRNGDMAAQGKLDPHLLNHLIDDPYFARQGPKSTGREQFGDAILQRFLGSGLNMHDQLATAIEFTAATIAACTQRQTVDQLLVSGGGVHNRHLMTRLGALCAPTQVMSTASIGIDPDAKEAILMAMLAWAFDHGVVGNFPSVTGASEPCVLGASTPHV